MNLLGYAYSHIPIQSIAISKAYQSHDARDFIPAMVTEKADENEVDDDEDEEGELVIKEEEDEGVDEETNTESEEDSELKGQGNELFNLVFCCKDYSATPMP